MAVNDDQPSPSKDPDDETAEVATTKNGDPSEAGVQNVSSVRHGSTVPKAAFHKRCVSFGEDVKHSEEEEPRAAEPQSPTKDGCEEDVDSPSHIDERRRVLMAFDSFRQSMRSLDVSEIHDDHTGHGSRWKPWVSWSLPRFQQTAVGCFSSIAILTIRLLLDTEPTAYLIHSIIVFLDMILIHLFTNCPWLSISGEVLTVICFLAFHFTKETLYELLETTLIAVLCSFHLILSRHKAKNRNEALETDLRQLRQTSNYLLHNIEAIEQDEREKLEEETLAHSIRTAPGGKAGWLVPVDSEHYKKKLKVFGGHFFEHFLDGSAGVMYTSFLGLIIDELLAYGDETKSY